MDDEVATPLVTIVGVGVLLHLGAPASDELGAALVVPDDLHGAHGGIETRVGRVVGDDVVQQICREEGLSQAQYVALWVLCLSDAPEARLPIGAIADGLLNRASDTTRLVDRLEKGGLAGGSATPPTGAACWCAPLQLGARHSLAWRPSCVSITARSGPTSRRQSSRYSTLLGRTPLGRTCRRPADDPGPVADR
jgi:hypothetical protein